ADPLLGHGTRAPGLTPGPDSPARGGRVPGHAGCCPISRITLSDAEAAENARRAAVLFAEDSSWRRTDRCAELDGLRAVGCPGCSTSVIAGLLTAGQVNAWPLGRGIKEAR